MASAGHLFASGSNDTTIWLYNTHTRREVGSLSRHNQHISALAFWKTKHLLSASHDGSVCVWRVKDWECLTQARARREVCTAGAHNLRQLEAHKRGVQGAGVFCHGDGHARLTPGSHEPSPNWPHAHHSRCRHQKSKALEPTDGQGARVAYFLFDALGAHSCATTVCARVCARQGGAVHRGGSTRAGRVRTPFGP